MYLAIVQTNPLHMASNFSLLITWNKFIPFWNESPASSFSPSSDQCKVTEIRKNKGKRKPWTINHCLGSPKLQRCQCNAIISTQVHVQLTSSSLSKINKWKKERTKTNILKLIAHNYIRISKMIIDNLVACCFHVSRLLCKTKKKCKVK